MKNVVGLCQFYYKYKEFNNIIAKCKNYRYMYDYFIWGMIPSRDMAPAIVRASKNYREFLVEKILENVND